MSVRKSSYVHCGFCASSEEPSDLALADRWFLEELKASGWLCADPKGFQIVQDELVCDGTLLCPNCVKAAMKNELETL